MKYIIDIDEKTMKNLKTIYVKEGVSEEPVNITEVVRKVANGTPVRKGKWELVADDKVNLEYIYKCSECGREVSVYNANALLIGYPFCHCGAEME